MAGIDNSTEDFSQSHRKFRFLPKSIAATAPTTTQVSHEIKFRYEPAEWPNKCFHAQVLLPFDVTAAQQDGLDLQQLSHLAVDLPGPDSFRTTSTPWEEENVFALIKSPFH